MRSRLACVGTLSGATGAILALALGLPVVAGASEAVDYERQVKVVLKQRCWGCHGAVAQKAGLRLDTAAAMRAGGDGGAAIEPGDPDGSLVIERVTELDPKLRMPPEGSPLTAEQVQALRGWIAAGAIAPSDERPEEDPGRHWAFQPIVRPAVPVVRDGGWVRNPVDAFLAAEQEKRGLSRLGEAAPEVLLRRVYFDLIGLPPTRAELQAFRADPSEAHYRQIVDRLLASPQYGERWGRHWMDVWRYSDWYGRRSVPDVLNSYGMIWRWRDWIIGSLNDDRPYDWMVGQMLAGDELNPTDTANVVATGFVVRNFFRWNYNSWLKDSVEHTAKAFLGLTVNCAHCHDHKYDPIKQTDYFALRACFEPIEIRHDRVPGEPDPGPYPKYSYGAAYGPIQSGLVRVMDEKLDAATFVYSGGDARNVIPGRPPIAPGVPAFLPGGGPLAVEPVTLPDEAAFPGLKAFIQEEERATRRKALVTAQAAQASAQAAVRAKAKALAAIEAGWADCTRIPAFRNEPDEMLAFAGFQQRSTTATRKQARGDLARARQTLAAETAAVVAAQSELAALEARIAADLARHGRQDGDPATLARAAARAEKLAAADRAAVEVARAELAAAAGGPEPARAEADKKLAAAKTVHAAAIAALAQAPTSEAYTALGPSYPTRSTGRRTALARWITSDSNPLAARVAVNHLWRWHFGTPLVATTQDLGRNGKAPSHPELLDWLAAELKAPSDPGATPWSMKRLHRLIVTSSAYRMQSSTPDAMFPSRAIDPGNVALWHFPPQRLEAEAVRDALLHVAGQLDPRSGGPELDLAQGLTQRRRSLYFSHHGEARMPFLELFDAVDACDGYKRSVSVIPQQALALTNNAMLLELASTLETRLWAEASGAPWGGASSPVPAFLNAAFETVLSRSATSEELGVCQSYLERAAGRADATPETAQRARRDLVLALFNHNDFLTVH